MDLAIVNAGDVVGGLGRIVLDNSRYYLLGYYSDSTKWSRKFLKIDVRVKRPGLSVRARRGFMPPDPRATAKAREAEVKAGTSPALKAALSKPVPIGDLPLRLFAAAFKGTGSNGSLFLALEIDGGSLKFEERDGRFNEKIEVSIVAADQRARVQAGDRQEFNLSLQPATRERIGRTGVRLLSRLELPPGRYQIHVGAHEASGATIGTVPYDVEIPDYAKSPFELSGVVLTSSNADSFVTSNPDPLLKDALPASPIATRSFSPAETLTTYAELYVGSGPARAVTMMTSVQDARDGRTVFQAQDRRAIDASARPLTHGFSTQLPLKNLSPGRYLLRVGSTIERRGLRDGADRALRGEIDQEVLGPRSPVFVRTEDRRPGTGDRLERQPEPELRRASLCGNRLQILRWNALDRTDPVVVIVENVEDLRDPIDRKASAQPNPLLHAQVGSILLRRDQRVARDDGTVGPQPLTVRLRQSDEGHRRSCPLTEGPRRRSAERSPGNLCRPPRCR